MNALELKLPPPVVGFLVAAAMWGVARIDAPIEVPTIVRHVVAGAGALAGCSISLAGVLSFRRAGTTVNPLKPGETSAMVTTGIYRFTRNPMYVGLLLILLAWAVFLSSAWALAGPVAFVLYIDRFQIAPEERILGAKFGSTYSEYKARVRRWL